MRVWALVCLSACVGESLRVCVRVCGFAGVCMWVREWVWVSVVACGCACFGAYVWMLVRVWLLVCGYV